MTDKYELYGFWRSMATYRVRVALALKGLDFSEQSIDLLAGAQYSDDMTKRNPQNRLPVMMVGDNVLAQSLAIIEYLEEVHREPSVLPGDAIMRAKIRGFALINIADTHPLVVPVVRKQLAEQFSASEEAITEWAARWHAGGLKQMNTLLEEGQKANWKYCFGNEPSLADIALASHVAGARIFGLTLDDVPNIAAVFANCMELKAFSAHSPMAMKAAIDAKP